jgi:hypothetical protein
VPDSSHYLWADAICINQNNIQERNIQAQMMGSIYRTAHVVVAWLGPEEDNSTEVIEILKEMAAEIESSGNANLEALSKLVSDKLLNYLHLEGSDTSLLSIVYSRLGDFDHLFSNRQYWTPAWILQELVLSQHDMFPCGKAIFSSSEFCTVYLSNWIALCWIPSLLHKKRLFGFCPQRLSERRSRLYPSKMSGSCDSSQI